ncbi:MAG: mechanosensitive ion channel protein [Deltaproteobacteria bacterium]|nr:MAG: mechanosensitive ion channel protein [Deltaproteobacteria bacterium]
MSEFANPERVVTIVKAALLLIAGLAVAKISGKAVDRTFRKYLSVQRGFIAGRVVYYAITVLVLISVLRQLGFEFTVLLGAAGVFTVALAFASQTSASNLISGVFLMVEEPFAVGDLIKVGETLGEVLSVDLLSVKLRTFDNLFVRIPNETMLKTEVTNLTRFPIRRADIQIGVAYKEDIGRVRDILLEVAKKNPHSLEEPRPLFIFKGYGDSSLDMQFSVWTLRENFVEFRNTIYLEIKHAFDRYGVEIPFPHRSIYTGSVTEPFPVRMVGGDLPPKPEYPEPPQPSAHYRPPKSSAIVEEN